MLSRVVLNLSCQAVSFLKNIKFIRFLTSSLSVLLILAGYTWGADRVVAFYSDDGKTLCSFKVELAVTPEEQARGLMYRKSLKRDAGMLFVYSSEAIVHFWMKNTYIPLDMVFINSQHIVTGVHRSAKPHDETAISSGLPVRYVLEINAGRADQCGVKAGSKAAFKQIDR